MAANRYSLVHATVYDGGGDMAIKYMKEHDDSNLLSIGSRLITADEAKRAINLWLNTPFTNDERHVRRLAKIEEAIKK